MSFLGEELKEQHGVQPQPRPNGSKKSRRLRPRNKRQAVDATEAMPWFASWWAIALSAVLLAFAAYWAALRGPLLFDDLTLPIASPFYFDAALSSWITGVRPMLMLTYWLNYQPTTPSATFAYHATNVAIHAINAVLVFLICRHLFTRTSNDWRRTFAVSALCCSLFLLHPLQTESVAYIAGRSEVLSATFVLSAWFLYVRRSGTPVTGRQACAILFLFVLAVLTKEQAAVTLPSLLVLTDWTFRDSSMWHQLRLQKRLYVPLCLGALIGAAWTATILFTSRSAGMNAGMSPVEYFLSQCRAVLLYLRLFVLPVGQNADREFPISRNLLDHGAGIALLGLAALIAIALRCPPLVRYGALLAIVFLAPTSSFIPLADPFAERRMYLPIVGLAISLGAILMQRSIRVRSLALSCVAVISVGLFATASRAEVWSDGLTFWQDVVAKSPGKARGYQHLAASYMAAKKCDEAIRHLEAARNVMPREYLILINWAQAYTCVDRGDEAVAKLREAERMVASADVYGLMGDILTRQGKIVEAEKAFRNALAKQQGGTDMAHVYAGNLALIANDRSRAQEEYERALSLNPYSPEALRQLRRLQAEGSPAFPGDHR